LIYRLMLYNAMGIVNGKTENLGRISCVDSI